MDLYSGKVGDMELVAKIEEGKIIFQESYPIEAGLEMLVDKIEQAIPGDQTEYANMLKVILKAKLG